MPVHDWTLVEAGIFHAFHTAWIPEIQKTLNGGLLPRGYYALAEQHTGSSIADLLTLHADPMPPSPRPLPPDTGGIAVAEAPPRVARRRIIEEEVLARQRALAIRHISGHRLIAILEIVSPANKDRARSVEDFAAKVASALRNGVHFLMIDLLPPGRHDPQGMHAVIEERLTQSDAEYDLLAGVPLTVASYVGSPRIEAWLEHLAVGAVLPDMPLYLRPDRYVPVPLEATYRAAYEGMPEFWREVLEGRSAMIPPEARGS